MTAACVVATWPEAVGDEEGLCWVRLDKEADAQHYVTAWYGPHCRAYRHGRFVMVRTFNEWGEEECWEAHPGDALDDAAVYVRFEAYEDDTASDEGERRG